MNHPLCKDSNSIPEKPLANLCIFENKLNAAGLPCEKFMINYPTSIISIYIFKYIGRDSLQPNYNLFLKSCL